MSLITEFLIRLCQLGRNLLRLFFQTRPEERPLANTITMAAEAAKDQRSGDEVKASLLATLKSKIETLGEKNGETLEAMHHLAYFLKSHEEYDEAEELLQKAITISEELIGKDDGQTLFSMGCLAIVYSEHGKYAEAETLQQQILETKERVLGKDHPDSLVCRERLAWTLHSQGKYQKCRDLYPPPPKEQDPNVITAVMDDTSRLDEAEKIYIGSMELKERVLGEEHPETLKSMAELASWFSDKCKRVQAERLYRRVLKLRERVLRPDNEVTLATKRKLAQVLSESGKYLEAEKTLRELLEVQEKALGHDNPKVLKTMGALPMVLKALGKLDDAEKTLQQLVALKSNLHGEDHLDTLESMDDLAIILAEQERYAKAEGVFRRITEIRKKTLGANDPKTLRSLSYLALMLEKQDKHEQADEILEQQALASEEEEAEADTEEAEGKAEEAGPKTEDAEAKAKAADPKTEEEAEVKAKQGVGDARKEPGFFKYKPLKSTRSTRVIDLYPSRYKSAALVIGLREVELDENDPPSYAAISYSVDRQKADKRVFCHGKKFMVSKNVEDVLRQFRQPEKMSWLWIDAISISQTSTKERNQQILLMEDIYRLAEVVAVWLGPSTELTEAAFEYFTAVARKHYCMLLLPTICGLATNDFL
jgi:tetratricopeptide (TPR) repeat protein